jgi:hypothetical protein
VKLRKLFLSHSIDTEDAIRTSYGISYTYVPKVERSMLRNMIIEANLNGDKDADGDRRAIKENERNMLGNRTIDGSFVDNGNCDGYKKGVRQRVKQKNKRAKYLNYHFFVLCEFLISKFAL